MTNPTPPLTAEQIASQIITDVRGWGYYDNYNDAAESSLRFNTIADAIKNIKAYAAQQNAELVAENERLDKAAQFSSDLCKIAGQHVEELQAENERLKQQLEWQPIETASKDGTPVLVLGTHKYSDSMRPEIAMYKVGEWRIAWAQADHLICNATHWMPLPQPPKEAT